MTTALPPNSETRVAHSQVELALTLELEPDSANALLRTLVLLHRRCCRVTEAEYRLGRGYPYLRRVSGLATHWLRDSNPGTSSMTVRRSRERSERPRCPAARMMHTLGKGTVRPRLRSRNSG